MKIIEISSLDVPGLEIFSSLTEKALRSGEDEGKGIFIAESPKVIKVALDSGYEPLSLLCEKKHITGDALGIIESCPDLIVYTGERSILSELTGYTLTRGVLCAMKRKPMPCVEEICKNASCVAVIDGVCDTTNIGSIFRSAAALGIDAVLLSQGSCDPLNRRSVRVSMGSVFLVPWTFVKNPAEVLRKIGFSTIALALDKNSLSIDSPFLKRLSRKALFLGTEGDGLSCEVINTCDYTVRIPMYHTVDSLNVGAAAAVAFWELGEKK